MNPLVSINCTTYNHALFVRDVLDGFIMQKTNFPFEVVLHDDASTDGTQDIIREYEKDYPEIFNVIYQKENQYSKNVNIWKVFQDSRCRGKYTAICEGDDYWTDPYKLQLQVDYMEKHEDCSLVFHPVFWIDGLRGSYVQGANQPWLYETDVDPDRIIAPGIMAVDTCSVVYRSEIGQMWPEFREIANIGDYPLVFLLLALGKVHYLPQIMGAYRFRRLGSWTKKLADDNTFAEKHHITALKWLTEYNVFTKGRFVVPLGKKIWYNIDRLDAYNAIEKYPWLGAILLEATDKITSMSELEKLAKETNDESVKEKHKTAEREYWTWFVNQIGEKVKE